MEIDIDLALNLDKNGEEKLSASIPKEYVAVRTGEKQGGQTGFLIRRATDEAQTVNTTVGALVLDFLQALSQLEGSIRNVGGELRLGIYYDVDEVAVFPLRLSAECVSAMARFNLALDCTGYPTSED